LWKGWQNEKNNMHGLLQNWGQKETIDA
jgi:hypothetical protein